MSFRAPHTQDHENLSTLEGILRWGNRLTAGLFELQLADQSDITFPAVPPQDFLRLQRRGNNNSFMTTIITEMESPGVSAPISAC